MKGRMCCFLLVLQIVGWVLATSRPLAPLNGGVHPQGIGQRFQSSQVSLGSKQGFEKMKGEAEVNEEAYYKIGSSPPSCEHKCFGCSPCEAIQVPTTSSRVGVQYTNYEPEGWKCKCGPSFYSP